MKTPINWQTKYFKELSLDQLYDLMKLRVDIFIVEQNCPYHDLDSENDTLDRHKDTLHLLAYQDNTLVSYLRILAKGQSYTDYISIGRVIVVKEERGSNLGHDLMTKALELCNQHFSKQDIKISAQQHLAGYYQKHGFKQVSPMYLEDNIPHIAMLRETSTDLI